MSSLLSLSLCALLFVLSTRFFPGTIRVSLSLCVSICCPCVSKLVSRHNDELFACVGLCVIVRVPTPPTQGSPGAWLCLCLCLSRFCLRNVLWVCRFPSWSFRLPPSCPLFSSPSLLYDLRHLALSAVFFIHCPSMHPRSTWSSLTQSRPTRSWSSSRLCALFPSVCSRQRPFALSPRSLHIEVPCTVHVRLVMSSFRFVLCSTFDRPPLGRASSSRDPHEPTSNESRYPACPSPSLLHLFLLSLALSQPPP